MRSSEYIETSEVVAEVAMLLGDTEFTHGVTKSFYETLVHRCIENLATETYFSKLTVDVFNWNKCGTGKINVPKGMFNVTEIYLFNSSCDNDRSCSCGCSEPTDCSCGCSNNCCQSRNCWSDFVEAHWKRRFNTFGSTGIKTSSIAPNHLDPVNQRGFVYPEAYPVSYGNYIRGAGSLVYFNFENGQICFSDNANCYKNMRIVANTFGSSNCELPRIPRELRNVVVDYTKYHMAVHLSRLFRNEYFHLIPLYDKDLNGDGRPSVPGSMIKARRFILSLNNKQRTDMFAYMGNITIK